MKRILAGGLAVAAFMLPLGGTIATATSLPANCTALNRTYAHGIMKKHYTRAYWSSHGATGRPAYKPVLYSKVASSMDRDHDGIACEK